MSGDDLNTEFKNILTQAKQCFDEISRLLNCTKSISQMPEISDAISKLTKQIEDFNVRDNLQEELSKLRKA